MEKRTYLLLWLVSLFTLSAVAEVYPSPGYMDSYYYYHVAANLARGRGLVEDFVWNYLTALPTGIPQPAHLYWMPLTSLLAAPFLALLGESFRVAQLPFILLASLVPPVAAGLAWHLVRDGRIAISTAFLTLFAGFYFSYWPAIDSFGSFALAATVALVLMDRALRPAGASVPVDRMVLRPWSHSRNGKHQHGHSALLPSAVSGLGTERRGLKIEGRGAPAPPAPSPPSVALPATTSGALAAAVGCGAAITLAHLARADGILLLGVVFLLALTRRPRGHALALALVVAASYLALMWHWLMR
ncbi:MAG: hypothetical protein HY689_01180, partial [Chloroflexi bacterium]|nr:hypothetical protein [Chloroflexota bacterium]